MLQRRIRSLEPEADRDTGVEPLVSRVLAVMRERTGTDFSAYRRPTIVRRIRNRMISAGVPSLEDYLRLLVQQPEEAGLLLERLTIKVSRFYRDVRTFDFLRDQVLPLLARARGDQPVRIWSAGCGHGEEAWTLAMLLDCAGIPGHVDATDIDPSSLENARHGLYRREALADLPANLVQAYFERESGRALYRIHDRLRWRVRFSPHDLTGAAKLPDRLEFDLVCCRNVLIYLEREAQRRALAALRGSLVEGGFLCLGEAEWPLAPISVFLAPVGRKTQIFRASIAREGQRP